MTLSRGHPIVFQKAFRHPTYPYSQFAVFCKKHIISVAYAPRVENVVNYTIENELTSQCGVDVSNTRKIKALMQVLSGMVPFEVDVAKMSRNLGLQRLTVLQYLKHLEDAKLIRRLFSNLLTTGDLAQVFLPHPINIAGRGY